MNTPFHTSAWVIHPSVWDDLTEMEFLNIEKIPLRNRGGMKNSLWRPCQELVRYGLASEKYLLLVEMYF